MISNKLFASIGDALKHLARVKDTLGGPDDILEHAAHCTNEPVAICNWAIEEVAFDVNSGPKGARVFYEIGPDGPRITAVSWNTMVRSGQVRSGHVGVDASNPYDMTRPSLAREVAALIAFVLDLPPALPPPSENAKTLKKPDPAATTRYDQAVKGKTVFAFQSTQKAPATPCMMLAVLAFTAQGAQKMIREMFSDDTTFAQSFEELEFSEVDRAIGYQGERLVVRSAWGGAAEKGEVVLRDAAPYLEALARVQ